MRKARSLNPRNKASVVGDRLIVNGKRYYHYIIPKRWLDNSNEESVAELSSFTQTNSILRCHAETIISHAFEIPCSFSEVPL